MRKAIHVTLVAAALVALGGSGVAQAADARQCTRAERKVTKEENWFVRANAAIERDRKGRESCSTPAVCARYDARLKEMDKRKLRHDARLARFKAEAAKACAAG